jgi:2'-5' RNA ligase
MRTGKRLFVGVRVSVATANALAACAETLARRAKDAGVDFRWVAPVNYHVTLAFLGWTGLDAIGAVCDALEAATAEVGSDRMTFRTTRLGAFGSHDETSSAGRGSAGEWQRGAFEKASVLWAGVEDAGGIARLAASIGDAMAGLGFRREARGYHPHVTLARLRETRAIREVVLPMSEQMFGDTRIDAVTLFESETKSNGSVYHELEKIALKRASNPASGGEKRQTGALERGEPARAPNQGTSISDEDETDDGWPRGQGPT